MKAVLLAAGEGIRMRPLTYTRPKVMLPIANKPILEHLLLELEKAGIGEFILVVGYHAETVRGYFGNGARLGVKIGYVTQKKQLGTANALQAVEGLVGEDFLLANGDVLLKGEDITRVLSQDALVLSLAEVKEAASLGVVEVEGDRVVRIYEKVARPPTNLANAGLYRLTPDVFSSLSRTKKSPRGEYEITDTLQTLIDEGKHLSWVKLGYWLDMSYPWDLLEANESLLKEMQPHQEGEVEENVILRGKVSVGRGTRVKANTYVEGPVIIGEDCQIGPGTYLRSGTVIGDGCHIGSAVEIKNSIIMKGTNIPHHNYVGDSIIGEGCNFGAGTKVANLRLDEEEVQVMGIATGRRKLGAILGDGVKTGINVSINVGSLIGNNCHIGPGAVVSGIVLPESRVF